jgi:hypothetical protein
MPSLRSLDRRFRPLAEAFFGWARGIYPDLVVTSSKRTRAEQTRLYERAQAGQNDGLPATPPGHSSHELGLAFDMARLNVKALSDPVLAALGAAWRERGGTWWAGDPVHFAAGPLLLGQGRVRSSRKRTRLRRTSRRR